MATTTTATLLANAQAALKTSTASLTTAKSALAAAQAAYQQSKTAANAAKLNAASAAVTQATTQQQTAQASIDQYTAQQAKEQAAAAQQAAADKAAADAAAAAKAAQQQQAAKLAAAPTQTPADQAKALAAGGQSVDQIVSTLQNTVPGISADDARNLAYTATGTTPPTAQPVAPTPAPVQEPVAAAPVAPAGPTLSSDYDFIGKHMYIYSDGTAYRYDPATNTTVNLTAGGQQVDTLPDGSYATATGAVASADQQQKQYQATQQPAQPVAPAPTPTPTPTAPVAPTLAAATFDSPATTTFNGVTYYRTLDPATGQPTWAQNSNPAGSNYMAAGQITSGQTAFELAKSQNAATLADQQAAQKAADAQAAYQAQQKAAADQAAQQDAANAARVAADEQARQAAAQQLAQQQAAQAAADEQARQQQLAAQKAAADQAAQQDAANAARVAADQAARQAAADQLAQQQVAQQQAEKAMQALQNDKQKAQTDQWISEDNKLKLQLAAQQQAKANDQAIQQKAMGNYAVSQGGFIDAKGVAWIPNPDPSSLSGQTINGQNMVNISDPYTQGYATNNMIKAGISNAAQTAQAQARSNQAGAGTTLSFSDLLKGAALLAIVAGGASLIAGSGAGGAAGILGETESSMAAADAMQLAAQGMSQEEIAATLSQTYGIDGATAQTMSEMATTTVADTGATTETLTKAGIESGEIGNGTSTLSEEIGNTTKELINPTPVEPTPIEAPIETAPVSPTPGGFDTSKMVNVDLGNGETGWYDPATGSTYSNAGDPIISGGPITGEPVQVAGPMPEPGPAPIETPVEPTPEPTPEPIIEPNPIETPVEPVPVGPTPTPEPAPIETPVEPTPAPEPTNELPPVEERVPTPVEPPPTIEPPEVPEGEVPVEDPVPTPVDPTLQDPTLGAGGLGGLSAADLAKIAAGWYFLNGVLTPPKIEVPGYGPIGEVNWGSAKAPVNPGLNPGYLLAPGAIKPQYHGTATQANYSWANRPLIQDQSQLNTWNTAVPAQQPWGAAYAQGVGPNKLDVGQFIQQYITPAQMYAAQGTAPQYAGPVAPATGYVGGTVTPG